MKAMVRTCLLRGCVMLMAAPGISLPTLAADADSGPETYEARYQASAMGMTATAYRSLTRNSDTTLTLQNSLSLTVFGATVGAVTETSRFRWQNDQLTPLHYRYEQTGISRSEEEVVFDWDASTAHSTEDDESWSLALQPGVMDKLGYSIKLGHDVAAGAASEFAYSIVDGDEIEPHLYRITAHEVIQTPAGSLNTVKIERVREPGSSRSTTVWLATDWDYLLVRLEQVNSSGRLTELNLESATMEGTALSGL